MKKVFTRNRIFQSNYLKVGQGTERFNASFQHFIDFFFNIVRNINPRKFGPVYFTLKRKSILIKN